MIDVNPWHRTHKGDVTVRGLADRHYTRQSIGAAMFTRPGYSHVLLCTCGQSGWVWWRPKWEDGRPGTARKDGLRTIECTLFRREAACTCGPASALVLAAQQALDEPAAAEDLHFDTMGPLDADLPLLTAIGVTQTSKRRGRSALPGACYRAAGWTDAPPTRRPPLKGKVWLFAAWTPGV